MDQCLEMYPNQLTRVDNDDINDIDEVLGPFFSPPYLHGSSSMNIGMVEDDQSQELMGLIARFDSWSNVGSPSMELAPPSNVSTLPSDDDCIGLNELIDTLNDVDVHHKEKCIDVKSRLQKKVEDRLMAEGKVFPVKSKEYANNDDQLTPEEIEKIEVKKARNRKAAKKSREKKKEEFVNDKEINSALLKKKELLRKQISGLELEVAWRMICLNNMEHGCSMKENFNMPGEPFNQGDTAATQNVDDALSSILDSMTVIKNASTLNGSSELISSSSDTSQLDTIKDQSFLCQRNVPSCSTKMILAQEQIYCMPKMSQLVTSASKYPTSGAPSQTNDTSFCSEQFNFYSNSFYPTGDSFITGTGDIAQSTFAINYHSNEFKKNISDFSLEPAVKKARIE